MERIIRPLTIALGVTILAGCASKPPAELPRAPVGTSAPRATPEPVSRERVITPGSKEDFMQSVSSDRVFFDTDQFNIDAQDQATLQSQARWLLRYSNVNITIEGHADERGTRDYNLALGERRANSAKNSLAALGVAPSRITTVSYGKERPDALGSNASAWARNRRAVTVTIH